MHIEPIGYQTALGLVAQWHYSKVMPAQTRLCLGGFRERHLIATSTWGWGVRPLHTIRRLFPSLTSKDYWELGKLCVVDTEPRNTESHFLSGCISYIRHNHPQLKLLFTWADGILGKPGYVYQAAGWLYGGYIWTDAYFTQDGEKVHPRLYQTKFGEGKSDGLKYGKRPTIARCTDLGLTQYFGKQFRYIRFLCSHKERKRLLRESTVSWEQPHPKHKDLEWKRRAGQGSRVSCEAPSFTGAVRFRSPAPLFDSSQGTHPCEP